MPDALHVRLHGLFRNAQELPDIAVSVPITKARQNLNLAHSQAFVAHVLGELSRYLRWNSLSAGVYFAIARIRAFSQ